MKLCYRNFCVLTGYFIVAVFLSVSPESLGATRMSRLIAPHNSEKPIKSTKKEKKPLIKGQKKDNTSAQNSKRKLKQAQKSKKITNKATTANKLKQKRRPASALSLEDSLGDTEKLKAQLLKDLEEDHNIGSKNQGLKRYFQAKVRKNKKKKFEFKDMDLKVVGHHEEKLSTSERKNAKRTVSSKELKQ